MIHGIKRLFLQGNMDQLMKWLTLLGVKYHFRGGTMTTITILIAVVLVLNVARLCLAIRQARKIDKIETNERQERDVFLVELKGVLGGADRQD